MKHLNLLLCSRLLRPQAQNLHSEAPDHYQCMHLPHWHYWNSRRDKYHDRGLEMWLEPSNKLFDLLQFVTKEHTCINDSTFKFLGKFMGFFGHFGNVPNSLSSNRLPYSARIPSNLVFNQSRSKASIKRIPERPALSR